MGKLLPGRVRLALVVAVLITGAVNLDWREDAAQSAEESRSSASILKDRAADFNAKRSEIIAAVQTLIDEGKYADARRTILYYSSADNRELAELRTKVVTLELQQRMSLRKAELLGAAASEKDYGKLADIYVKLQRVDPLRRKEYVELAVQNRILSEQAKAETAERNRHQALGIRWRYQTHVDDVSSGEVKTASVRSENEFEFNFPYQGRQRATLTVRQHPRWGLNIFMEVERGQFLVCADECTATVRFGSDRPTTVTLLAPTDMSSTVRFFKEAETVIEGLQQSEILLVEMPFYSEGTRVLRFHTGGLKW